MFGISEAQFFAFVLILLRVGSLFVFAPVFSSPNIPGTVKSALVLGLSVSLAALGVVGAVPVPESGGVTALFVAQEILLGMLFGFVANLIFAAVQLGGQVIGIDMGLGIVNVFDPQFETQVSVVSQLQTILAFLLFLAVGGDRLLIEGFAVNFSRLPPGALVLSRSAVEVIITLTGSIFRVALQVAAPVIAALFAANVILGIFARSVPQMNMLILGFPLKIFVGFAVLGLSLPHLSRVFLGALSDSFEAIQGLATVLR